MAEILGFFAFCLSFEECFDVEVVLAFTFAYFRCIDVGLVVDDLEAVAVALLVLAFIDVSFV